ncbi:MAG: NAD(P)/FAD-dependent oxidoreductase [Bacteroidota bacterium]
MPQYDVALVGAGHNGLVAAGYLAKAGYRVAVFERRPIVGGAVSTTEIVPGYKFDLGGSAHILIRTTPIVQELALESYGLEYLELDPLFFAPFPDGDAVFFYRDLDRTCQHLESKFPGEGEAYRRFVNEWMPFSESVRSAFLATPNPLDLGRSMAFKPMGLPWDDALPHILRPYGEVVNSYFREEKVRAPIAWMAAQSGPPPTEPEREGTAHRLGGRGAGLGGHPGNRSADFLFAEIRVDDLSVGPQNVRQRVVPGEAHRFERHRAAEIKRVGRGQKRRANRL